MELGDVENYIVLFLLFAIYSFLGWILETTFATIRDKKFINRGFLTGCFCPIYGVGAVLIIEIFSWINIYIKDYYIFALISVIVSIVLVTILEYLTGLFLEKLFNFKWWDYSDNYANIQGYICLKYSILWGGLAFVLVQVIHPLILNIVLNINNEVKTYMVVVFWLYFIGDAIKSVIDALNLRQVVIYYSSFPIKMYYEKIVQYKRFFIAYPRLLLLNSGVKNRDIKSVLNSKIDKMKNKLKNRLEN